MHINDELGEIEAGIAAAFTRLRLGGRLAVISFHSLEDATVKRAFRTLAKGPELPRRIPVRVSETPVRAAIIGRAVRPGEAERARNPRARSAVLRVLERRA